MPFHQRGAILDEQLEAMRGRLARHARGLRTAATSASQTSTSSRSPSARTGRACGSAGSRCTPPLLRRLVRYGHGFHPFGSPTPEELERLRAAMAEAGRDAGRARDGRRHPRAVRRRARASPILTQAAEAIPGQLAQGYTSICFKPSMFTDDIEEVGPLCRELVARVASY